ncbi:hypothetical protein R6Q59_016291 [Mikania micrantha]
MKMGVHVMIKLLCLFMIMCAQYFPCVTSCFPFVKPWNLHVINGIAGHADKMLKIHVKSEKNDFGFHNLTYKGPEFYVHFCETITHTTVFAGYFWYENKFTSFYLFNDVVSDHFGPYNPLKTQHIYWLVKEDGFYISGNKDSGYERWPVNW